MEAAKFNGQLVAGGGNKFGEELTSSGGQNKMKRFAHVHQKTDRQAVQFVSRWMEVKVVGHLYGGYWSPDGAALVNLLMYMSVN